MRLADASLDKNAENVKMKAEDDGKSSYDQVIDELAELLRERKDNKALSFWDKLESRVSTANGSYKQSQNTVSSSDPVGSSEEEKGIASQYNKYGDIIIKALEKTKTNIHSYYRNYKDFYNMEKSFDDACEKIVDAIKNGTEPESFTNGLKIRVEINPNYNTSSDELLGEIAGFVPVLGELSAIVDFASDESKESSKLFDMVVSAVTEKDIAKLTPFVRELDSVGKVVDFIGVLNGIETLSNWNSNDKIGTTITVYAQINNGATYMYKAVVDNELMFKEYYSSYTGSVIKPDASQFEINDK